MSLLFDIPPIQKAKNVNKCKHCESFEVLEYESKKRFFYCSSRKSKRTENGYLKIKANDNACFIFKKQS